MTICDPAEDERSDHRAHDVEGCNGSEVGAGKMERLGALQGRPQRADDGDLEPVEDPGDAQPDDDQQMKPAPGQPIEAKRDVGPDHGLGIRKVCVIRITSSGWADSRNGRQPASQRGCCARVQWSIGDDDPGVFTICRWDRRSRESLGTMFIAADCSEVRDEGGFDGFDRNSRR